GKPTMNHLLIALTFIIAFQAQPAKKPVGPKNTRPRVAVVPGPERITGDKFQYVDDEAAVTVVRLMEGKKILRASIYIDFKLATSERGQSRQEVLMLTGAESDAWQTVTSEEHRIVIGGPKKDTIESYRVNYYANHAKIASMDTKTGFLGKQAEDRALR